MERRRDTDAGHRLLTAAFHVRDKMELEQGR